MGKKEAEEEEEEEEEEGGGGGGGGGGAELLYLFTAQRCVPLVWLTLAALCCQPTVLDLHYDLWQLCSHDNPEETLRLIARWSRKKPCAVWDTKMS